MQRNPTPVRSEVLPAWRKSDVDRVEGKAKKFYSGAEYNAAMFAVELRRLQDGGAHLMRGYSNFGAYVERTFDGITATNAGVITRQGMVLLVLDERGRINLDSKQPELPGTTALRALSTLHKQFGEETMVAIYDRAKESGRKIVAEVVAAAARELVHVPPVELGETTEEPESDDDEEDYPELTEEQESTLDAIADALHELRSQMLDPMSETYLQKCKQELKDRVNAL